MEKKIKQLLLTYHPDKTKKLRRKEGITYTEAQLTEKTKKLQEAKEMLADPIARYYYNIGDIDTAELVRRSANEKR